MLNQFGRATGVIAFFSGLLLDFGIAVGVSLAVAAECHSYLV
jgi:hypothetical protein